MANRILILSANQTDADILKVVLGNTQYGAYNTVWARQLSAGLARLRAEEFDAILADLSLPDSSGIASFEQLFAAAPHTPILTLSMGDDDRLGIEAVQRGAQGYLARAHFSSSLVPQTVHNIVQRAAIEKALYKEKARADISLNSISDAVIGADVLGKVDYLNFAAENLTGWSHVDAQGHPIDEVFHVINGDTRKPARNAVNLVLSKNTPVELPPNTLLVRRDGTEVAIEDLVAPIHDRGGKVSGAVIVFHDVTEAHAMMSRMAHLAHHDFLTNLPNRVLLNDRIAQAIAMAQRRGTQLAVLFLDLDNFKHINDSLGHATGDKLLQSVAERLSACVRSSDTVSRQGGDEFVILLAEDKRVEDAIVTADKIIATMTRPHSIARHDLHVTTSIGVSVYPADGHDAETLIKNADTAMYHAKEKGRNNYQFFSSAMNVRAVERQFIEVNLRQALENQELVLYYQPKVNLDTGKTTGSEALLRWMHPKWGMVLPDRFVPIAEDSGLIVPIGQWVLHEACAQAKRWLDAGLPPVSIAVNISALEFRHKNFFEGVRAILSDTGLAPHHLQLEITEGVLMRDAQSSAAILQQLKQLGVQLAVDDFGTGYSSLSYLTQFPIDVLKIDQSFVHDIGTSEDKGIIVSAVIGMGNSLKLQVVAEGVETPAHLAFLKARQCEEGQGYFFSRPLAATDFGALLEKDNAAAPADDHALPHQFTPARAPVAGHHP